MAKVKRRRRKPKPLEEAIQFSVQNKDKDGLEGRFINDFKGRGVFSCIEFDKGEFLLEYRGDLISKEECERRQRIYHNALKVFMFEFRYNGKLLCVDAARDDGSLGRLVNDDHINPNSKMKTIRVDGKPHLCLFATRSINPGEEITYDYGDSEWPWRCMVTCKTQLSSSSEDCAALTVGLDKTLNEVDSSTIEMNTLSQSEFSGVQKVMPEKEQLPMEDQGCAAKVAEKMSPVKEHLVNEEKSSCAPTEVICEDTTGKDQLSLEDQVYAESVVEKMSPVKEHLVNEEKSFCAPTEGVNEDQLPIEDQVCVQKMSPIKEHLVNEKSFCAPTEVICEDATENDLLSLEDQVCVDKNVEKVCKHDVVTSAISSMDKCAECVGPVAALKWFGLRCKYEISMTDSDASDPDESDSEDDAPAGAAGVSSNADVQKMPIEKVTEVSQENESEAENPRKGQKVYWSNAEVTAVMKHFKAHITKGKLAILTECKQCKTAEEPVLGKRSAQNIRDFVRNRGISVKRKAQNK